MCDVGQMFGMHAGDDQAAAARQQQQQAQDLADQALKDRQQAAQAAAAAAAGDSEQQRKAAEVRMQKLLGDQGYGVLFTNANQPAAPVQYKTAMGA